MHRTQIYLNEHEKAGIQALARLKGKSVSAIIREAVDAYLRQQETAGLTEAIGETFGIWRDRDDIDLGALRYEWERRNERLS